MRRQAAMLYGCQHGLLRRPLWLRGGSQGHLSLHRRSVGGAKTIGKGTSGNSFIHSFSRLIQRLFKTRLLRGAPSPVTAKEEGLEGDVKFGKVGHQQGTQLLNGEIIPC